MQAGVVTNPDLFAPRAVAVIGASPIANAVTARPLRFLKRHGFEGRIYAVNPRHDRIGDVACYPSVRDLPERPDVAMVGVPAGALEAAVSDCAAVGVPLVCIFTAAVDDAMKARLTALAAAGGTRILGPNSLGFIDVQARVACTYSQAALVRRIPSGSLSIVSQSGGLGGCLLNRAVDRGIGIARFLTPGAGIDIDLAGLLDNLALSPATRAVASIVESIPDGARFIAAVERLHAAGKRLVIWRIGVSAAGRSAAVSHTGALASDERVFSAVCRDLGISQVHGLDELLDVAAAAGTRQPTGRSVGVITSSGGAAIVVADALEAAGLPMPPPSATTIAKLRATLSPVASISNPLDLGAGQGSEAFRSGLHAMLSDPAFDTVVLALTMVAGDQAEQVMPELIRSARHASRPLAVVWPAGSLAASWRRRLRRNGLAVFEDPAFAARALQMLQMKPRRPCVPIAAPSAKAAHAAAMLDGPPGVRTEWRTRQVFALYGIESPREALATHRDQAVAAARSIGFPVALKIQSPLVPHRARAGALRLDLGDEDAVARAFDELVAALEPGRDQGLEGILVQAMVAPEQELFLGVLRDPTFGVVIACGLGGGDVEKDGRIDFVLPTEDRADLVARLGERPLGARIGAVGIATVADLIGRLSRLAVDLGPALGELDLNPVALVEGGSRALALDALAVIAEASPHAAPAPRQRALGAA